MCLEFLNVLKLYSGRSEFSSFRKVNCISQFCPAYNFIKSQDLTLLFWIFVCLSIDEINNWNSDLFDETDVDENDSKEDNNVVQNSVAFSYSDAINATNMLIKRSEQNAYLTAKHMSNLLQIQWDIVKKQILKPSKQTKLTIFFIQSNE